MKLKLWICGQYRATVFPNTVWDFQGIFLTKNRAITACKNENYFIAPAFLNEEIPSEPSIWPGVEYPIAQGERTA